jgi:hypothetical protein
VKYFFAQDNSSHWYKVQAEHRTEWNTWRSLDEDDEASWDEPEFAERLAMHPSNYNFSDLEEAE